jgi:hypothetical protein
MYFRVLFSYFLLFHTFSIVPDSEGSKHSFLAGEIEKTLRTETCILCKSDKHELPLWIYKECDEREENMDKVLCKSCVMKLILGNSNPKFFLSDFKTGIFTFVVNLAGLRLRNDSKEKTVTDAMQYNFLSIGALVFRKVRSYASMPCLEATVENDVQELKVSDKTKELGLNQICLDEFTMSFIKIIDELGISHRQIYIPDLRV